MTLTSNEKFVTADGAAAWIRDGATIGVEQQDRPAR